MLQTSIRAQYLNKLEVVSILDSPAVKRVGIK